MAKVYFYDLQDSIVRGNVMDYGGVQPNSEWKADNISEDVFVDFEHAPRKALFAIKCSQGNEQRIFTCDETNKICWY